MPTITIQGQVINFPDSGTSPNWAQAVIDFATATQNALEGTVGIYDISPQLFIIDAYNPVTNQNLTGCSFPDSQVRAAFVRYTVYRTTSTVTNAYEAGTLEFVYNVNNPVGHKWEIQREYIGDAQITFSITDNGQVQFSTAALSGLNHAGKIGFSGQALLQA